MGQSHSADLLRPLPRAEAQQGPVLQSSLSLSTRLSTAVWWENVGTRTPEQLLGLSTPFGTEELSFMWEIAIDIYHMGTEKFLKY